MPVFPFLPSRNVVFIFLNCITDRTVMLEKKSKFALAFGKMTECICISFKIISVLELLTNLQQEYFLSITAMLINE